MLAEWTRYTFGTSRLGRSAEAFDADVRVAHSAMEAGCCFHCSQEYTRGNVFMVLRRAFDEAPRRRPKIILKVRCERADWLTFDVEDALRRLGLERVAIAQLCIVWEEDDREQRRIVEDFLRQGPMWAACRALKERGLVGGFVLENFAGYSGGALAAVAHDLFDGYIFYYNVLNREASNALFAKLSEARAPLVAMRVIQGGLPDPARAAQAAGKKTPDPLKLARRETMEKIYERSGDACRMAFSMRFMLSTPGVCSAVGGTSSAAHLQAFLQAADAFIPLPDDLMQEIQTLHREWFKEVE